MMAVSENRWYGLNGENFVVYFFDNPESRDKWISEDCDNRKAITDGTANALICCTLYQNNHAPIQVLKRNKPDKNDVIRYMIFTSFLFGR